MTLIINGKTYEAGELVAYVVNLEKENAELKRTKEGKVVEHFEAYGQCRDSRRIAELEQKLEQTEKDLADYQFNYPTIKELEKENAELKEKLEHRNCLDCSNHDSNIKLAKAKKIIKEFMKYEITEYDGSLEIHFEELKKQAEQFLSEVEK